MGAMMFVLVNSIHNKYRVVVDDDDYFVTQMIMEASTE